MQFFITIIDSWSIVKRYVIIDFLLSLQTNKLNMKNIELLEEIYKDKEIIEDLLAKCKRFRRKTGISIEILELENRVMRIRATQIFVINKIFTQKELHDSAKPLFAFFDGIVHCVPMTYRPNLDLVNVEFVKNKMKEYNIKKLDVCRQTGLDKTFLSDLFTKEEGFNQSEKALFYYYFNHFKVMQELALFKEVVKAAEEE